MYPMNTTGGKYRIVVLVPEGKVTVGRFYSNWEELQEAIKGLREIYAKHGINHYVGYIEVCIR